MNAAKIFPIILIALDVGAAIVYTCCGDWKHDMYPSGAGVCLNAHYNTKERIEALFALGDLSGLGGRLSNDDPGPDAQDVCHAYHRDYGEELCPPRDAYWAEYVYLFRDGKWYVNTTYRPKEWRLVEEVLKERNNG